MTGAQYIGECDNCRTSLNKSKRYQCLDCSDFDLCGLCFERHVEIKNHKLFHLMVMFDSPYKFCDYTIKDNTKLDIEFIKQKFQNKEHKENCKTCGQIIKGLKLKCDICQFYYQCFDCHEQKKISKDHTYESHPMIVSSKTTLDLDKSKIEILKEIGKGGFGVVHLAKYTDQDAGDYTVALKIIGNETTNNDIGSIKSYLRELDAYNEINGQNILRMIGNKLEEDKCYIATEYMEKGCLKDLITKDKDFGLYERFKVAFGLICGIIRIHEKGLVHRDIRPDNVLISHDFTAKIGDFGIAKLANQFQYFSDVGCRAYMPPEFYLYPAALTKPSTFDLQKIDIYTYGLTLLEIFYGKHGRTNEYEYFCIRNPLVVKEKPKYFEDMINKCIDKVASRPTALVIFEYLITLDKFIQYLLMYKFSKFDSFTMDEKYEIIDEALILFQKDIDFEKYQKKNTV